MKILRLQLLLLITVSLAAGCGGSVDNTGTVEADTAENTYIEEVVPAVEYQQYCNHRYGYCLEYPATWTASEESENIDGRTFFDEGYSAVLSVYGTNAAGMDFPDYYEFQLAESEADIKQNQVGDDWYMMSGMKAGKRYYERSIVIDETFVTLTFEFNQSDYEKYLPVWEHAGNSLQARPSL